MTAFPLGKVRLTHHGADQRREQILHEARDNASKCRSDHDAHSKVDDIASHDEITESLPHQPSGENPPTMCGLPCRRGSLWGQVAVNRLPAPYFDIIGTTIRRSRKPILYWLLAQVEDDHDAQDDFETFAGNGEEPRIHHGTGNSRSRQSYAYYCDQQGCLAREENAIPQCDCEREKNRCVDKERDRTELFEAAAEKERSGRKWNVARRGQDCESQCCERGDDREYDDRSYPSRTGVGHR